MTILVKLDDIIDGMESQSDESSSFLNKRTGEVVLINDYEMRAAEEGNPLEDFPDWEQDQVRIAREILAETGQYIPLPTKFDIDEYSIMERFCVSIDNQEISDVLYDLISGSGAFRRFKDAIYRYGIEDEWHTYHNNALKELAIEWCREHNIEFDEQ
ncbi:MAG: hypothetical protein A2Z38_08850 [Planctomycetes bacterium RBG_19FT_COMBO_48_8]|nr:MAG: hypothetical protein A2Z38_08850 [Planctomycetes bacterium RBG_19FT_COMBO_48_8]